MAPEHHDLGVVGLFQVLLGFQNTVDPARHRNTGLVHHRLVLAVLAFHGGKTALEPIQIFTPDARPVCIGSRRQAEITRQCVGEHAQIGRALHVVMATEDIGAAAALADIAKRQLQDRIGAGV